MSGKIVESKPDKVELGNPDVWVRRSPSGQIRSVKGIIELREEHGEIAVIEGKPMIAAAGYYRANQIASLAILTPDSIRIPGGDGNAMDVPNPFPIIDKESGTQKGVWVKKIVVGYSPIGSMTVSSSTLYYDFRMYFIQDLQNKIQYNKDAGRLCFEDQLTEAEKKTGIFMHIEGPFGVWANMQHAEIQKAVRTWLANKNFGDRKAQTIAERNALKHHPALSLQLSNLVGPEKRRSVRVAVIGWQHDHDFRELEDIALAADAGEEVIVDGQMVETIADSRQVQEVDVQTAEDDFDDVPQQKEKRKDGLF